MKITNQKVSFFGLAMALLFNVCVLSGFHLLFLGSVYCFICLSTMPGFFIQRALKIQEKSFFESILYTVGFSISYLYFVGLSTNALAFLLNMSRPLNVTNSLVIFDIYMLLLLLINQMKKDQSGIDIVLPIKRLHLPAETGSTASTRQFIKPGFIDADYEALEDLDTIALDAIVPTIPKVTFTQLFFYITPFLFPILSTTGAQLLNRSGTNAFIMVLLCIIAIYMIFVAIYLKKLENFCYEIPIYLIAISLLLMFSLRSSYVIGWDIYDEYKVFVLTESRQLWSMQNYNDPYTACLSITILPTLFHYFTKVDNPYVFKILYQCIFAFVPIAVYSLAKKFSNRFIAFLCAFFFMSTVDFFLEMPAIVRQEIAFLFFGLLLLMLFNKQIAPFQKKILLVIFSFSVIVSHYSTAYILIALFTITCVILIIYKKIGHRFFYMMPKSFTLEPLPIIIIISFAYLWLGVVTHASNNFISVINNTRTNITNFNKQTLNTSIVDQLINYPNTIDNHTLLNETMTDMANQYKHYGFTYYPKSTYKSYYPTIMQKDNLPLYVPYQISTMIGSIGNYILKVIKLLIGIGFIGTTVLFYKKFFPAEYGILSILFAIALIMITSVPAISLFYPIGRLDQQILFLIALPTILSTSWLLRFLPYKMRMLIIMVFFMTYFLNTTTFISQLVGGQEPQIFLNNSGRYYNEIYLHPSEIASIHWLYSNNDKQSPIFADIGSSEKIRGYSGQIYLETYLQVFPSLIDKSGYVYSSYANTLYGIGIVNPKDMRKEYNFPSEFLDDNKNLVYNNHDTRIYK